MHMQVLHRETSFPDYVKRRTVHINFSDVKLACSSATQFGAF